MIDPFDPIQLDLKLPKLEADVLLLSHDHFDHNYKKGVSGYELVIDGPGEYEVNGVCVQGIETFHDDKQGAQRGKNTIYLIEVDGFNVLHLGDLGHELSKETLERISEVDVLLIPVGGNFTIDAKTASKVISSLEPGIVIPMHYKLDGKPNLPIDTLDKFLDEMGIKGEVKKEDKLKLTSKAELSEETSVIVLQSSA